MTSAPRFTARADVATETPERYAKQLASHLGRRVPFEETPDGSVCTFPGGRAVIRSGEGQLTLLAEAADEAALATVQDVLGRHLERFGQRQNLSVTWVVGEPSA